MYMSCSRSVSVFSPRKALTLNIHSDRQCRLSLPYRPPKIHQRQVLLVGDDWAVKAADLVNENF